MRLHHLEISAFGPFADSVSVDFDALSDAGLFLLTGATGAGKTSILDAVCFALYGEVPGDRQSAKRLRADQAVPGARPQVTLETTLSGRRFRIVRSPAWERPKKRGTGTTTEQASVRISERRDGEWQSLSTRLDETGHLVTQLVGMNLTQFCQVAMLPQGRFQAFLRARSEERHKLLQQLFRTTRFEDIEKWLRDRRRGLRQESAHRHEVVADLVSRVSETADGPLPESWDIHDLARPASSGEIAAWSRTHRETSDAAAREADLDVKGADEAASRSAAALGQARTLVELQTRHAAASAERDQLNRAAHEHAVRTGRVAAARRAAVVLPVQRIAAAQAGAGAAARERSVAAAAVAAERLAVPVDTVDEAMLARAHRQALDSAASARALLPRETALLELRAAVETGAARRLALEDEQADVAERLAAYPAELSRLTAAHEQATRASHALAGARTATETLRRRHTAARSVATLSVELADARALHSAAVDEAQLLKERWLLMQEERINGMAAEIAGALAVGDSCPVCGSAEHPQLASARAGSPDAAAEKAARKLVDDAEATRHAHDLRVRDLTTRITAAEESAGADVADLADELAEAELEVGRLAALAEGVATVEAELASVRAGHDALVDRREANLVALTSATASLAGQQAQAEAIAAELEAALAGSGCESLAQLARSHDDVASACSAALTALRELDRAEAAAEEAHRRAETAAAEAGFDDLAAAVEAALAPDDVAELERRVQAHEAALLRTESVLAEPDLRAAAAVTPPDLIALEADHLTHAEALSAARTAAAVTSARAQRLAGLDDELTTALGTWAPLREDLDRTSRLASLVDGTSPDNRLQMRLSGYVLAYRLGQVVAAANERLATMSDQRYSLEHSGRKGAGETRGGLSLLVRDDWSGETRDPATLSGGETFVVSLALALGLADVIAHEVGGADLDTLFVDEGFGSLDAETLDDVMDTLDSLRDGGRVVGVVSHVAEMRDRIPTQLHVTKARRGSSVTLVR